MDIFYSHYAPLRTWGRNPQSKHSSISVTKMQIFPVIVMNKNYEESFVNSGQERAGELWQNFWFSEVFLFQNCVIDSMEIYDIFIIVSNCLSSPLKCMSCQGRDPSNVAVHDFLGALIKWMNDALQKGCPGNKTKQNKTSCFVNHKTNLSALLCLHQSGVTSNKTFLLSIFGCLKKLQSSYILRPEQP